MLRRVLLAAIVVSIAACETVPEYTEMPSAEFDADVADAQSNARLPYVERQLGEVLQRTDLSDVQRADAQGVRLFRIQRCLGELGGRRGELQVPTALEVGAAIESEGLHCERHILGGERGAQLVGRETGSFTIRSMAPSGV